MARSLSAKKRARQNIKRKWHNQNIKSRIKTQVKKTRLMLSTTKELSDKAIKDKLINGIRLSTQLIDKAVNKGMIHKNKAARLKSRLTLAANKFYQKT
jgi:small subunit ribosomal protein S20